jgi:hypothetical protein
MKITLDIDLPANCLCCRFQFKDNITAYCSFTSEVVSGKKLNINCPLHRQGLASFSGTLLKSKELGITEIPSNDKEKMTIHYATKAYRLFMNDIIFYWFPIGFSKNMNCNLYAWSRYRLRKDWYSGSFDEFYLYVTNEVSKDEVLKDEVLKEWIDKEYIPLDNSKIKELAEMTHENYRKTFKGQIKSEYDKPYADLPGEVKADNEAAAKRIPYVLSLIGLYVFKKKKPDDNTSLEVIEYIKEKIESLAKAEHEGWMDHKIRNGWVWGEKRDDNQKKHNSLIPYDKLDEVNKDKHRNNVLGYIKILESFGYYVDCRLLKAMTT